MYFLFRLQLLQVFIVPFHRYSDGSVIAVIGIFTLFLFYICVSGNKQQKRKPRYLIVLKCITFIVREATRFSSAYVSIETHPPKHTQVWVFCNFREDFQNLMDSRTVIWALQWSSEWRACHTTCVWGPPSESQGPFLYGAAHGQQGQLQGTGTTKLPCTSIITCIMYLIGQLHAKDLHSAYISSAAESLH